MACIRDELMVSTCNGHILRYHWNSSINRDYCLDLRRTPFSIDLHVSNGKLFKYVLIYTCFNY